MKGKSLLSMLEELAYEPLPTKLTFGAMMHDPNLSDEEKCEIARRVAEAGGYSNLN